MIVCDSILFNIFKKGASSHQLPFDGLGAGFNKKIIKSLNIFWVSEAFFEKILNYFFVLIKIVNIFFNLN